MGGQLGFTRAEPLGGAWGLPESGMLVESRGKLLWGKVVGDWDGQEYNQGRQVSVQGSAGTLRGCGQCAHTPSCVSHLGAGPVLSSSPGCGYHGPRSTEFPALPSLWVSILHLLAPSQFRVLNPGQAPPACLPSFLLSLLLCPPLLFPSSPQGHPQMTAINGACDGGV